jgi:hypothetical protein
MGAVESLIRLPCILCIGLFAVCFFALFFGLLAYSLKLKGRYEESMKALALELGCQHRKDGALAEPAVEGEYRGRHLLVQAYTLRKHHGTGVDKEYYNVTYTRAEVPHKGSAGGITVRRNNLNLKMEKAFIDIEGDKKVETGNAEFDKKYTVYGKDQNAVRGLLDVDVQQRMMETSKYLRNVYVEKDKVSCDMLGHVADKEQLRKLADLAVELAEKADKL